LATLGPIHAGTPIDLGGVALRAGSGGGPGHVRPASEPQHPTPTSNPAPSPADVIRAWPSDQPLGVVYRAGDHDVSRCTLLVKPCDTRFVLASRESDPLGEIERTWASTRKARASCWAAEPCETIGQGWLTAMSYELGRWIEPSVGCTARVAASQPLAVLQRFEAALAFDHTSGRWSVAGNPQELPRLDLDPLARAERAKETPPSVHITEPTDDSRRRYESTVARAIEYIRAGDVFQVNLAHALHATFAGDRRRLAAALLESSGAWHGSYIELDHRRAILSLSPELFVDYRDQERRAVMRPMKGTRPATHDPGELARSPKDHAELAMIIDLVRNDLGRVADFGSVRVEHERAIEHHGGANPSHGVWQGVATIAASLRAGMGPIDLVRAAFPSGSVTGAPKVRAMQIIDELEGFARGFYCGSLGVASDIGDLALSVAIRTAMIEDDRVVFPVGAGIVADSSPADEWRETLAKSGVLRG